MDVKWRFRIAIVNDKRNSYAVIDYKKFGPVVLFEAFFVSGEKEAGGIGLFYNYKRIHFSENKKEILEKLNELYKLIPIEAKTDFELNKFLLLKAIGII